jgi:hypothetical protein
VVRYLTTNGWDGAAVFDCRPQGVERVWIADAESPVRTGDADSPVRIADAESPVRIADADSPVRSALAQYAPM